MSAPDTDRRAPADATNWHNQLLRQRNADLLEENERLKHLVAVQRALIDAREDLASRPLAHAR